MPRPTRLSSTGSRSSCTASPARKNETSCPSSTAARPTRKPSAARVGASGPCVRLIRIFAMPRLSSASACGYLGETLAETRIQLCGRLVARIDGPRIEDALPGRQGRLAFAYLAVNRAPRGQPRRARSTRSGRRAAAAPTGSARCSRSCARRPARRPRRRPPCAPRRRLDRPRGRAEALHRAESAVATGRLARRLGPRPRRAARRRPRFLAGRGRALDRRAAAPARRAPTCARSSSSARACLAIGGGELDTAERAARAADRTARRTARAGTGC